MTHVPEAVTFARENANLTKRALAQQCGISEQLMGDIEAGRRNASTDNLRKFAVVLECSMDALEAKNETAPGSTPGGRRRGSEGGDAPNSAPDVADSFPPTGGLSPAP